MTSTGRFASLGTAAVLLGISAAPAAHAVTIFAIDDNPGQRLLTFDSATPTNLNSALAVSGLQANEKLIGIDFRISPTGINQGALYGVGSFGRIYTISTSTGAANFVASLTDSTGGSVLLNGTEFGFDFNPNPDRLRIISDLDQNLRVNVDTGLTIIDTPVTPASSNVTNLAYDRPDQLSGTPTTLYGIDTITNNLVRVGGVDGTPSPNGGAVTVVGPLVGIDPTSIGGFDIGSGIGTAFLAARNAAGGGSLLSTVDLNTGTASLVGFIGNPEDGLVIKGIAVGPGVGIPEPTTLALLGLAVTGLLVRRRRV